jgi:hypothetical protein
MDRSKPDCMVGLISFRGCYVPASPFRCDPAAEPAVPRRHDRPDGVDVSARLRQMSQDNATAVRADDQDNAQFLTLRGLISPTTAIQASGIAPG